MRTDYILPLAQRATGSGSAQISVPSNADLRLDLVVTASTAPTTLDATVSHSPDGGNSWVVLGTFTQVGAVGTANRTLAIQRPTSGLIKVDYTIAGTNYTFSVVCRSAYE